MAAHDEEQERKKQRLEGCAAAAGAAATGGTSPATPKPARRTVVLVHDLDETLLIFNSLLSGSWAATHQLRGDPAAVAQLLELGARWEAAILRLCDERFFFSELEDYDQTCLADIQQFDDGQSLSGYGFAADGFPPPGRRHPPHSPQEHASTARPAPYAGAAAAGLSPAAAGVVAATGGGSGGHLAAGGGSSGDRPAAAAAGAAARGLGACLDSPASRMLDAASLTRLAYRFRRIALLHKFGLAALGGAQQRQEWEVLYKETDAITGGWLSHASSLLAACTAQLGGGSIACAADGGGSSCGGPPLEVVHVAVTSGQLIPSLAKLLLFKLGGHIPAEHVWSSRFRGKLHCFRAVQQRFGAHCTFVAIGDGAEEDEAAAAMGWPYIRVLLAPAGNYPAEAVLAWRPDATGGPGLPFTQLTVQHIARAAGLGPAQPATPAEAAHGGSAAAAALEAAEGAFVCAL
ncbi:hypothetical protein ABPG75_004387 [Micractinium tetrahymenae]